MRLRNIISEPSIWAIDEAGRLWNINTRTCKVVSSVKLDDLPHESKKKLVCVVLKSWISAINPSRFSRPKVFSLRGGRGSSSSGVSVKKYGSEFSGILYFPKILNITTGFNVENQHKKYC